MREIHCHNCGGFIGDERPVCYELPLEKVRVAVPRSELCRCPQPVVYGPPPGRSSTGAVPAVTP